MRHRAWSGHPEGVGSDAGRLVGEGRALRPLAHPGTCRLITASYFHPGEHVDRAPVLRAAFAQLAPGGTLLVIDHASTSPWSWAEPGTTYPSAARAFEVLELPGARVLETSTRQRVGRGPDHRYATVEDNVIAVSRPEDPPREKGISASG